MFEIKENSRTGKMEKTDPCEGGDSAFGNKLSKKMQNIHRRCSWNNLTGERKMCFVSRVNSHFRNIS